MPPICGATCNTPQENKRDRESPPQQSPRKSKRCFFFFLALLWPAGASAIFGSLDSFRSACTSSPRSRLQIGIRSRRALMTERDHPVRFRDFPSNRKDASCDLNWSQAHTA